MNQQAAAMQAQAHLQAGGLYGAGAIPYLPGLYGPTNSYLLYGGPAAPASWAAAAYARSACHNAGSQGVLTGDCLRIAASAAPANTASCGVQPSTASPEASWGLAVSDKPLQLQHLPPVRSAGRTSALTLTSSPLAAAHQA